MNQLQELVEKCRDAVAEGDLAAALELTARLLSPADGAARRELILHRSRLRQIDDQLRRGVVTAPVSQAQRLELADNVLQFLDEVMRRLERSAPATVPAPIAVASQPTAGATSATRFDVFLSHHGKDKPAVREIARLLEERSLRVWLDEAELPPGVPWIPRLEESVAQAGAVAVFLGSHEMGPWQKAETWLALRAAYERQQPVIPVWLPGVTRTSELPGFLSLLTWVDLSMGATREGIDRLAWAITGARPAARS